MTKWANDGQRQRLLMLRRDLNAIKTLPPAMYQMADWYWDRVIPALEDCYQYQASLDRTLGELKAERERLESDRSPA